jgi:hypothetical protein
LPKGDGPALYRGWIVRIEDYARLEQALSERGYSLLNSAAAYQHCYHLPEWYSAIPDATPRSIWFPGTIFDLAEITERLRLEFGDRPLVLKDYVKSRKHEWFDACFIRSAADSDEVRRVVGNFLRLQEEHLVGGLVFREFIDFKRIGIHTKSRMPLVREYRFFVYDGVSISQAPYWAEGDYDGDSPSSDVLDSVVARVKSRFYAADVAQKEDGSWLVMELNDGGSAGVPEGGDVTDFYSQLAAAALPSSS